MLSQIVDSIIDWADNWGLIGLAIISSSEAMFQPAPPDLLIMPMALAAQGSFLDIAAIILVATVSSVLGSLGGYAIGVYAGRPVLEKFVKSTTVSKLDYIFLKYGSMGIFIAALSPIPYKALAWAAGSSNMDIRLFIAAGIMGRGIRFGLEGIILGFYGEEFLNLLSNPWFWLFGGILTTALFLPFNAWWSGLILSPDDEL